MKTFHDYEADRERCRDYSADEPLPQQPPAPWRSLHVIGVSHDIRCSCGLVLATEDAAIEHLKARESDFGFLKVSLGAMRRAG